MSYLGTQKKFPIYITNLFGSVSLLISILWLILQRILSSGIMGLPKSGEDGQNIDMPSTANTPPKDVEGRERSPSPCPTSRGIIKQYLLDRVPEFQKLDPLRQRVNQRLI